jgi:hypothetical protein
MPMHVLMRISLPKRVLTHALVVLLACTLPIAAVAQPATQPVAAELRQLRHQVQDLRVRLAQAEAQREALIRINAEVGAAATQYSGPPPRALLAIIEQLREENRQLSQALQAAGLDPQRLRTSESPERDALLIALEATRQERDEARAQLERQRQQSQTQRDRLERLAGMTQSGELIESANARLTTERLDNAGEQITTPWVPLAITHGSRAEVFWRVRLDDPPVPAPGEPDIDPLVTLTLQGPTSGTLLRVDHLELTLGDEAIVLDRSDYDRNRRSGGPRGAADRSRETLTLRVPFDTLEQLAARVEPVPGSARGFRFMWSRDDLAFLAALVERARPRSFFDPRIN